MKERYKSLLRRVYELEGLLLLGIERKEMPLDLNLQIRNKYAGLQRDIESLKDDKPETPVAPEPIVTYSISDEAEEKDGPFYALEDDDEPVVRRRHSGNRGETAMKRGPVFSLNDRFLFIRELFNGETRLFNEAVARLADYDDFDSAQRFLENDYFINPDAEPDGRFLTIVREYYSKR